MAANDVTGGTEPIALSLLNDYLYCPRRASLKVVEGWRSANEHTARGDIVHERVDLAGYETAEGATLLRALPVWSNRLGLNGRCDFVERRPDGTLFPVEFKLGARRTWGNDDAQLCAQAICLEEMFGVKVRAGAVYHATSRRRRDVVFTEELRRRTENAVAALHEIAAASEADPRLPVATFKPACEECSLFDICLPRAVQSAERSVRFARAAFED